MAELETPEDNIECVKPKSAQEKGSPEPAGVLIVAEERTGIYPYDTEIQKRKQYLQKSD